MSEISSLREMFLNGDADEREKVDSYIHEDIGYVFLACLPSPNVLSCEDAKQKLVRSGPFLKAKQKSIRYLAENDHLLGMHQSTDAQLDVIAAGQCDGVTAVVGPGGEFVFCLIF